MGESVLTGAFQVRKISEDLEKTHEAIGDAERAGHKFIRLELRKRVGKEMIVRIGAVKGIQRYLSTTGFGGQGEEVGFIMVDKKEPFHYDPQLRAHVCYILDDKDGYNRDFLASHILADDCDFKIVDEKIEAEIRTLAEKKAREAKDKPEPVKEKPLTEEDMTKIGLEGIDEQIAELQKHKKLLQDKPKEKKPPEPAAPEAVPRGMASMKQE